MIFHLYSLKGSSGLSGVKFLGWVLQSLCQWWNSGGQCVFVEGFTLIGAGNVFMGEIGAGIFCGILSCAQFWCGLYFICEKVGHRLIILKPYRPLGPWGLNLNLV